MSTPCESAAAIGARHLEVIRKLALVRTRNDPAHDWHHVLRVVATGDTLAVREGADRSIVQAAALLHEVFAYPKGHHESHRSGERCAEVALQLMRNAGLETSAAVHVASCIRTHPFSARLAPESLEGAILQDADRLDAIGAIGVARCFATCATMQRPFYDPDDPFCERRQPDDRAYGVDHFYRKLLHVVDGLHTPSGRALGVERTRFLQAFLDQLRAELIDDPSARI